MKRLTITLKARDDLRAAHTHIARDNEQAAERVMQKLLDAMRHLAEKNTGRYGRVEGTYEKSVTGLSFVIVYHFTDPGTLEILRVIHTRRNWAGDL